MALFLVFPGVNFVISSLFFFKYFYWPLSMSFHKSLHCSFTTENEGNSENLFEKLQILKAKKKKHLQFFNLQPFLQLCIAERKQKTQIRNTCIQCKPINTRAVLYKLLVPFGVCSGEVSQVKVNT